MPLFHVPHNNAFSTLTVAHAIGDNQLTVADASSFGTSFPVRVSTFSGTALQTIYSITGITGTVLTIGGTLEGTSDQALPVGTKVRVVLTAGDVTDLQAAITSISAGPQGSPGSQGNQGVAGAQGNQGYQGFQGFQGVTGAQGYQGNQGYQGATGTGTQGATGSQGNQGYQGVTGTQGTAGTGSVSSVALTVPSGLSVSGSPITGTGTLAVSTALSGIVKGTGTGFTTATAGTDYLTPTGSGAGLTALNASNLASGTVPTARQGSGTATSTSYLRGDQSWQVPTYTYAFTFVLAAGTPATTGTSKTNILLSPGYGTIFGATAIAKTGPVGADFIVDININGTSIWATNQANRLKITAGGTSALVSAFDTTSIIQGQSVTIDIDQVGSTVAGQDITVQLLTRIS